MHLRVSAHCLSSARSSEPCEGGGQASRTCQTGRLGPSAVIARRMKSKAVVDVSPRRTWRAQTAGRFLRGAATPE